MERFDYHILEARPVILDSEGFWKPHEWLSEVDALREGVADGIARIIIRNQDTWIITFGRGFHYEVEAVDECAECRIEVFHDEVHPDVGVCFNCAGVALEQVGL